MVDYANGYSYIYLMIHVSILVPESAVMEAVADPRYAFTAANNFLMASGKERLFDVQLVGTKRNIQLHDGVFTVHPDKTIDEISRTHLIIIPALLGDMRTALDKNKEVIPWIVQQYEQGAEVASLCVGAFLLAATGLLNGKSCSTHWAFYEDFKQLYPEVSIKDGSIITEEHRLYSSGGANSYWNLLLHLIEKYSERDISILTAKYFAIDIDRQDQLAFTMFRGQKSHRDEEVKKAQKYIEANYHDKITLDQLADLVAVSRRSFERRFKGATGNTVGEYVQRVKIEAAKRNFEGTRKNIHEVMFQVCYTDTKAFRSVFKKITGLTPIEYRNKYNKAAAA